MQWRFPSAIKAKINNANNFDKLGDISNFVGYKVLNMHKYLKHEAKMDTVLGTIEQQVVQF